MKKLFAIVFLLLACAGLFFGHQYYLQTMNGASSENTQTETKLISLAERKTPRPQARKIIAIMESKQRGLAGYLADPGSDDIESQVEKMFTHIDQVDKLYDALDGSEGLNEHLEWQAQMICLISRYLTTRVIPHQQDSFLTQAKDIIAIRPDHDDSLKARALVFCVEHQTKESSGNAMLSQFENAAETISDKRQAIEFHRIVANELWKNGQAAEAETVLESGMKKFKGEPSRIQLVNQLLDQGHRDPPNQTERIRMLSLLNSDKAALAGRAKKKFRFR